MPEGERPRWWAREMGFCRLVDVKLWDFLSEIPLLQENSFPCYLGLVLPQEGNVERVHTEQVISPGQTGVQRAEVLRFDAEMRTYGRRGLEVPFSPLPETGTCRVCGRGGVCGV